MANRITFSCSYIEQHQPSSLRSGNLIAIPTTVKKQKQCHPVKINMLRNILLLCIVGLVASSAAQEFGARIGKRVGRIGQSNGYFYPVPNPPFSLPSPEVAATVRPVTTARPVAFPTFPTVGPCQVDPNCVGANCRPVGPNCGPAPTVPIRTTARPVATTAYTTARTTTRPAPTVAYTTARPTLGPCQVDPFCFGPNCGPVGPNCKTTTVPVRTTTRPAPVVAVTTARTTTTSRPVPTVAYTTTRPTLGPCQVDPFCFGPNCGPVGPNCKTTTVPVRTTTRPTTTALPLDYLPPVVAVTTRAPTTTTRRPTVTLGPCQVDPNCVGANCRPLGPNCGPAPTVPIRTTPRPVATTPYTTARTTTTTRATTARTTTTTRATTTTTARPVVVTVRTTTSPPLDYLPPAPTKAPVVKPVTTTGYDYPTPENPLDFGPSNNQGTGVKFPTTTTTTTRRPTTTTPRRPNVEPVLTESQEEILFWDFRESIAGEPELDYPIFFKIPETAFTCEGKLNGYYADVEARCQVFHICSVGAEGGAFQNSFLCPNGTIFSQESFACLWWHDVECATSQQFFNLNANIGIVPESAGKVTTGAASSASGIQISASAGASSSSSGGRGVSAAASASSATFAAGNKQAQIKGGSSHSANSY
ncbi:mucin-2 [Daphnia magna]|uniref:mucin-2 n=1 Tax=Daphnia magna TaxID=35525 RepID=UPI001E1BAEFF|nr:mucin-2 [Daphnia magna]